MFGDFHISGRTEAEAEEVMTLSWLLERLEMGGNRVHKGLLLSHGSFQKRA